MEIEIARTVRIYLFLVPLGHHLSQVPEGKLPHSSTQFLLFLSWAQLNTLVEQPSPTTHQNQTLLNELEAPHWPQSIKSVLSAYKWCLYFAKRQKVFIKKHMKICKHTNIFNHTTHTYIYVYIDRKKWSLFYTTSLLRDRIKWSSSSKNPCTAAVPLGKSVLRSILGSNETMYCFIFAIKNKIVLKMQKWLENNVINARRILFFLMGNWTELSPATLQSQYVTSPSCYWSCMN